MSRTFTIASDQTLCAMIAAAAERLVLVAPGLSRMVAAALAERIQRDSCPRALSVILDVDPEVCRLGYGEIETFDLLRPALESRGLAIQTQKGVRIGLVVADADVMVYSPTPKLIEAGSTSEEKPNAIRITENGAQELALACGVVKESPLPIEQEVGRDIASPDRIEETKADLKENPPRQFDLVRLERVFNYKLEFVEFSVEDYRLNTRSVTLPAELLGLAEKDLKDRIRNSFRVFETGSPFEFELPDPDDANIKLKVTEKWLTDEAARLRKEYFIPLGSKTYGNLILKRRKAEFEGQVKRLTSLIESYAEHVRKSIEEKVSATRDNLIKALYPRVKAAAPPGWLSRSVDGKLGDDAVRKRLEEEVDQAFEEVKQSFNPTVTCIFKGVNYETITKDEHFRERIEAYFGKEEAAKLLSEYDASRAQKQTQA
ncbi:MAG: hypothetical protein MOB07_27975 [Acidobacteria bacterium]|nr:hypothetical protein [Acidobacteriota bacterium]